MLWRVSPRSRRSKPAGFIVPAQPALVTRPPTGPDWIHEIKHDGYRVIARKEAGRVTLWTRHGTDFTDRLPRIAEAVRSLPVESALIDGEAVVFRPDGHSDFAALRTKAGAERAAFVAFDLLSVEGEDVRKLPLEVRRARLEGLIGPDGAIVFSEALEVDGALVFAKACELGVEGIVSKRRGSVYLSGACRNWLEGQKSGVPTGAEGGSTHRLPFARRIADVVRIDCPRCDRAGSYRRDSLMVRFGADIALPDLLLALASCDRRKDFSRPCGARFTDLAKRS